LNQTLRIAKNVLAMSAGKLWMMIGNMVLAIVAARLLGVTGFGSFVSLTALFELFSALVAQGLSVLVCREIAKDHSKTSLYLSNGLVATIGMSLLAALVVILLTRSPVYSVSAQYASFVVGLALFPGTACVLYQGVIIAYEKVEYIMVVTAVENVLRVTLTLIALWLSMGLPVLFAVLVLSQVAMLSCYHYLVSHRLCRFAWTPSRSFLRALVREWRVFGLENGLAAISPRIGVLSLTYLAGAEAVGLFAAASKLLRPALLINSYVDAIFPHMSRVVGTSEEASRQTLERSLKYLLILMLPLGGGLFVLADQLILLLYSPEYAGAAVLLRLGVWGLLPGVAIPLYSRALIANGDQRLSLRVAVVRTALYAGLSAALALFWGALGAVIAGLMESVVTLAMFSHYVSQRLCKVRYLRILARPALATVTMAVVAFLLHDVALYILILVSACIYAATLFLYRVVTPEEREMACQLIRWGMSKVGWVAAGKA
jgi:O-antigen/teichoic acid export membrane protein